MTDKTKRGLLGILGTAAVTAGIALFAWYVHAHPSQAAPSLPPPATADESDPHALRHYLVVWVKTDKKTVTSHEVDDPYHPGQKITVADKPHEEESRLVCAKEWVKKENAMSFMQAAPADVKQHMHLINEDE
jgi:hypothetical protein